MHIGWSVLAKRLKALDLPETLQLRASERSSFVELTQTSCTGLEQHQHRDLFLNGHLGDITFTNLWQHLNSPLCGPEYFTRKRGAHSRPHLLTRVLHEYYAYVLVSHTQYCPYVLALKYPATHSNTHSSLKQEIHHAAILSANCR
jgi:hypothetical protein